MLDARQMTRLAAAAHERFLETTTVGLRRDFERLRSVAPEALRSRVLESVDTASRYGIHLQADVAFYVRLEAHLGSRIDCDPRHGWLGDILRDDRFGGTEKIDRIHDRIVFGLACNG